MKKYLIVDIGTSSLRVLIMDKNATIIDRRVRKRVLPACFDADEEWLCIRNFIRELTSIYTCVCAASVSALLGWVFVDEDGTAVTPCYSYMHKCTEESAAFAGKIPDAELYGICGRRLNPEWAAFKALMLAGTQPETWEKVTRLLSLKDYINLKLTGQAAMDHVSACYTMLYDIRLRTWSDRLLLLTGIDRSLLPPLLEPSAPVGEMRSELCGLSNESCLVAAGSVDGSTGILGAGGIRPGMMVNVMGTTDTCFSVQSDICRDATMSLIVNPHVMPDMWLAGGPMGMFGGALDWLLSHILYGGKNVQEMDALAAALPCGSEGVTFIPALIGERAPFWQPEMRGTICGLTPDHRAEHLFRAIMEANCFAVRRMVELLEDCGKSVTEVTAIGGGANSDVWLQIRADVLGLPVSRRTVLEATAIGSCRLAIMAGGNTEPLTQPPVAQTFTPRPEHCRTYESLYQNFMRLHAAVSAGLASAR